MSLPLTHFTEAQDIANLTARALLDIEAILINAHEPFTLTSGRKSPVYVDVRRTIGFPLTRRIVTDFAVTTLLRETGFDTLDGVAGGETAGIPFAAWIAERLGLPMSYVRKEPKGFGRMAQIEGSLPEGARVALIEDLATDGGSKLAFIHAMRKAGAVVEDVLVVFHYGIFPQSTARLAEEGVRLHALTTWRDVLYVARHDGRFDETTLDTVEAFLEDPESWKG